MSSPTLDTIQRRTMGKSSSQFLFDTLALFTGSNGGCAPRARNEVGMLAEQFAARTFRGLELTPIRADVICPDFRLGNLRGEIKSVGKHKQALIYKWRLEKEEKHYDPNRYLYLFIQHSAKIGEADRQTLASAFASPKPPSVVACTVADLRDAIGDTPSKKFSIFSDPEHGSQREGYRDGGWHLSLNRVETDGEVVLPCQWPFGVWDQIFVRVRTTARFRYATVGQAFTPDNAC